MEAARLFIVRRIIPEDRGFVTPCWVWQGTKNEKGYARAQFHSGKNTRIHRLSYEAYIGPIPDGLQIDHLCSVTSCVNPAHLEPVTGTENRNRQSIRNGQTIGGKPPPNKGMSRGGWQRFATHCQNGHELTPDNVAIRSDGGRRCIACRTAGEQKRNVRKREKRAAARRISQGWGVSQSGSGPHTQKVTSLTHDGDHR